MRSDVRGLLLVSVQTLAACGSTAPIVTPPPADPPPDPNAARPGPQLVSASLESQGLSSSALDRTVDPCVDFYQFACGGWERTTSIPDDRSRWFRSFSEIDQRNEGELRAILEQAVDRRGETSREGKLGSFYAACMDTAAIDRAGLAPLRPLFDTIAKVKGPDASLTTAIAALHAHGLWAFFDVSSGQDAKDATRTIGLLDQNGLGLPDREDYLLDTEEKRTLRAKYEAHLARMFSLAGRDAKAAARAAATVVRIETALAKASKSRVERRDPSGMYNRVDREGLAKLAPTIAWDGYFSALGASEARALSITAPKFFEGLDALVRAEKAEALRDYLTWHVLHRTASNLGAAFEAEAFALTQLLTGQKVERARFKRCIDATDEALGELLAQPFVERRFAGESKLAAESYVRAIAAEMRAKLDGLAWMDAATRDKARAKLDAMAYLIGFPAKWKSYDFSLGEAHAANVLAGATFRVRDNLAKIGKPVDRGEWFMTPPTVNAYYDPQKNQMVFPAGILQPPFYSASASVPVNLGAMGMVVGHELTHGFDDEGSQFDAVGNLASWWSPDTRGTFEARAACVDQQYAAYEVLPGVKLNGKLTLGENIADAGGVELAFRAYRALRRDAPTRVVADGLDEDQQFFAATGQIWCAEYRDEAARLMAATDPHSHPRYRVNGPLSHLPAFAEAFACKPGSPMVAAPRCEVW